jgi:ribosomal protein S18 acetylase RimI-like enzyme
LRALNILRDLPQVADLIELCFANTMDSDGQRYVADMRRAGRDDSFLRWATKMAESTSLPLTGYIWEESGKVVGNASLVPFRYKGKQIYLIANVATHPDFRHRGIARAVTERALQHAAERKVSATWLHVRDDNPDAINLYTDLGFVERARRTSWQARGDPSTTLLQSDITITTRTARDWPQQQDWLRRLYPDALSWYRQWNFSPLRPGLWNWFYLAFVEMNVSQWSAMRADQLQAALAWIPFGREGNSLWLATGPDSSPEAVTSLLIHARRALISYPRLALEYPAGESDDAIRAAGFTALRTLIWMEHAGATS